MKERARRALGIQLDEFAPAREESTPRLLGRFDEAAVRRELAVAGVLAALQARGDADPVVTIEKGEGEQRLLVAPRAGRGEPGGLADGGRRAARHRAAAALPRVRRPVRAEVHWLALQDPQASFTAARPRLPGQTHPGLRLGRQQYTHVVDWARTWGKDALVNAPAYFHNGKFYAPPFTFLSPAEQGRFEALVRDLGHVPVAEASAAFEEGRLMDATTARPVGVEAGADAGRAQPRGGPMSLPSNTPERGRLPPLNPPLRVAARCAPTRSLVG